VTETATATETETGIEIAIDHETVTVTAIEIATVIETGLTATVIEVAIVIEIGTATATEIVIGTGTEIANAKETPTVVIAIEEVLEDVLLRDAVAGEAILEAHLEVAILHHPGRILRRPLPPLAARPTGATTMLVSSGSFAENIKSRWTERSKYPLKPLFASYPEASSFLHLSQCLQIVKNITYFNIVSKCCNAKFISRMEFNVFPKIVYFNSKCVQVRLLVYQITC
jgi:hypothetical protein